ncbi:MAG: methylenetetrahydrofolate--tRNA-(uracil(54)-C(5))-methyltransferase (FADH(2)-oxidizing) TrmFO [SAR116 cluster bacterium MED-G04]|jgi:methylenetetrahydrofolate--tRNA-(uracil-5-)-methyltransferase|nr:MAG: methylenetetrahydrofolate--tRNA-(uracil(54)-C(5))-methyltransferase (FADH(2)-oxidizing) TrmFO [SAR116 cluster bacterium MED-G04]HCD48805.1 FADH(2)-oxidizing methylenetetrahydrofolate--tRNA-(uracil(54)-C(5))-methyltransferase TrmFO [Alphaproteobacteria bacterium]HCV63134.1 FADH(2)-oxidizing methylenetetrahydrofolate--tRNA-(uracil(54)-C(5))-methyltransferase TrmFO [Alphaproteobacteria bacterium]|tara:strand:- start:1714 stop:3093 length:1380 start_codon:yes stop_codon:yes gene_type:complete
MADQTLHVIGGGMAGCEAAWQAANRGVRVVIHEMRPHRKTDAHKTEGLAELVCSNSFRSDDATGNAVGVLHAEMRMLSSIILGCGDETAVPAGGALAVDRDQFSAAVEERIKSHPMITVERGEVDSIPPEEWEQVIIATGPLTSTSLGEAIRGLTGEDDLAFFDAIAPIVHTESINMDIAWFQSRYDKGDGKDYINCPLDRDQYHALIDAMLAAEKMDFHEWESNTPYFEGCMPIEVMAERGIDTPRFGPMKPVGLNNPRDGSRPHAVVQLRQDNALGTLYNMVGFQTKMRYGPQVDVFRMIPGLENAAFARLGGLHRNTFIRSPKLLDGSLRLKVMPRLRFAGQMTGVEGYVESAAIGLMAGRMAAADLLGEKFTPPPLETAHGALLSHITGGANSETFQPMNVNFGLFPELILPDPVPDPVTGRKPRKPKGRDRKALVAQRALDAMQGYADLGWAII